MFESCDTSKKECLSLQPQDNMQPQIEMENKEAGRGEHEALQVSSEY